MSDDDAARSVNGAESAPGAGAAGRRAAWELEERVADLEAELAQRVEREVQRDAEITALRHELELRASQDAAREERLAFSEDRNEVQRQDLEWLKQHLDDLTRQFGDLQATLRDGEAGARVGFDRERAAERAALAAARQQGRELQAALERCEQTLAEERSRVSYRIVQKAAASPLARRALRTRHRGES